MNTLKVMYVGGIYGVEMSMWYEVNGSPTLRGCFCSDPGDGANGVVDKMKPHVLVSENSLQSLRNSFNPHLTIFRTWNKSVWKMTETDLAWAQEIMPLREDGTRHPYDCMDTQIPPQAKLIMYQNQVTAKRKKSLWMPYCVSKHAEKRGTVKDIPILVATNLPPSHVIGNNKIRSCDILLKPVVDWNPSLLHAYTLEQLGSIEYLGQCIKGGIPPTEINNFIPRAKIWISPTSIWYDEGAISYETLRGMACGTLTLTNKYPGIEDVLGRDGDTIIYANTVEETLDKVKYYLSHDSEREKIASRGYEFVHNEYNFETHLRRIAKELGVDI